MDARHPHTQRLREGSIAEMFGRMLDKFSDNDSPDGSCKSSFNNSVSGHQVGVTFLLRACEVKCLGNLQGLANTVNKSDK